MPIDLAASVAIIQNGQILLVRRADVEAWTLPGGQVDVGESVAEAARREAHEETGLEVELTRLVGIYSIPRWIAGNSHHNVLFVAKPMGGAVRPQAGEVTEVAYFAPDALPEPLVWWQLQRIRDALSGGGGVAWLQNAVWPFGESVTRQAFYELMAGSGLSKQAFFLRYFSKPEPGAENLEVLQVG